MMHKNVIKLKQRKKYKCSENANFFIHQNRRSFRKFSPY